MKGIWKSLRGRCAPMWILCVVLFIVLPIIVAMPLVIWLTRQMDRMPLWANGAAPSVGLTSAKTGLGEQQVRAGL